MKLLSKVSSVFLLFALVACSGGGGDGGSSPTTPPTTPPTISTYSISGTTSPGAMVTATGSVTVSTTADGVGNFTLSSLPNGSYTVTPHGLSGIVFTPTSTVVTVNGADVAGVNFTGTLANVPTYSISGMVSYVNESGASIGGVPGVVVSLNQGASAITDANGVFVLSGLPNGSYTITPSLAGHTFTPTSRVIMVNGASVAIDFVELVPMLRTGKLIYPCNGAICTKNLVTGAETVVWGAFNVQPSMIVPFRGVDQRIALGGYNFDRIEGDDIGGIYAISLVSPVPVRVIPSNGFLAPNCLSATMERSFDISVTSSFGDVAVIPSPCSYSGMPLRTDIFAVKMDGSLHSIRITDDPFRKHSPVFGSWDGANRVSVLYFKPDTGEIWEVIAPNVGAPVPMGTPTLFESSAMDGERVMAVSPDYTQIVFMRNVGGQSHVIIKTFAGGAEVDLGRGSNPHWALDGSNFILYSAESQLWAIFPDGTGKNQVPIPSNVWGSLTWVVFGPAGF